jgi:hypothetical protein
MKGGAAGTSRSGCRLCNTSAPSSPSACRCCRPPILETRSNACVGIVVTSTQSNQHDGLCVWEGRGRVAKSGPSD